MANAIGIVKERSSWLTQSSARFLPVILCLRQASTGGAAKTDLMMSGFSSPRSGQDITEG